MKKLLFAFTVGAFLMACGNNTSLENQDSQDQPQEDTTAVVDEAAEISYPYNAGADFDESLAITPEDMMAQRQSFEGDSMDVVLAANINECCKKKGCWMTIDMENGEEMMVRFRDYDFFVPLNADGRSAILKGKVFNDTLDVATLKHYAEDAGASADSIAKITEPQISYSFLADGVVVQ